jgi:hypothetical protein
MGANPYVVQRVARQRTSQRRAVAFLKSSTKNSFDAESTFLGLKRERERELRDRFDYWIDGWDGRRPNDKYFHGWPNHSAYKECFAFKWNEKGKCHRLYGFLIHPTPLTNPRFQVCVLVSHGMKTTWETDPRHLERARALACDPLVIQAVRQEFPEQSKGERPCLT